MQCTEDEDYRYPLTDHSVRITTMQKFDLRCNCFLSQSLGMANCCFILYRPDIGPVLATVAVWKAVYGKVLFNRTVLVRVCLFVRGGCMRCVMGEGEQSVLLHYHCMALTCKVPRMNISVD
jgi:hypothetical protein